MHPPALRSSSDYRNTRAAEDERTKLVPNRVPTETDRSPYPQTMAIRRNRRAPAYRTSSGGATGWWAGASSSSKRSSSSSFASSSPWRADSKSTAIDRRPVRAGTNQLSFRADHRIRSSLPFTVFDFSETGRRKPILRAITRPAFCLAGPPAINPMGIGGGDVGNINPSAFTKSLFLKGGLLWKVFFFFRLGFFCHFLCALSKFKENENNMQKLIQYRLDWLTFSIGLLAWKNKN